MNHDMYKNLDDKQDMGKNGMKKELDDEQELVLLGEMDQIHEMSNEK
jgi:hypothetical protein